MIAVWIILGLLGIAAVVTVAVSRWIYKTAFYNKNDVDVSREVLSGKYFDPHHDKMIEIVDKAMAIPFEEVFIKSCDGLDLFGRIYHQKDGAPFHIQFHGYRGNGIRDFSGGLQLALSTGDNVILIDQRAHGRSGGHVIAFGLKERFDVLSWVNYVIDRYGKDTEIFLEGVSMGAATVLMASSMNLPDNVKGIVADCPYSSAFGIVTTVARNWYKIGSISKPFIFISALLFGRFNILASELVKAVKETKVPILLIHGTVDDFVPFEMSEAIKNANPEMIRFVPVEGASHGISCLVNYELYKSEVYRFWKENTAGKS